MKLAKSILKKEGYYHVRNFSISSWKAYANEHRFTLVAKFNSSKYFIKFNTTDNNICNSIKVSEVFGNKTDFIPYGEALFLSPFYCYKTVFVPSYSFFEMKKIIRRNISEYIIQAIAILNELNKYNVVHQDLDYSNLIFRKKDKKMMLIDFDNSFSTKIGLKCRQPPYKHAIFLENGEALIDDAYAFYDIFIKLINKFHSEEEKDSFEKLKGLIGRNQVAYRWKN